MATQMDRVKAIWKAVPRLRDLRGEQGVILPVTLLVVVLLTALGSALLTLSSAEVVQGRISQNRLQALNLAEAGQVYARRALSLGVQDLDGDGNADQTQVFTSLCLGCPKKVDWDSTAQLASLLDDDTKRVFREGSVTIVSLAPTDPDSAVITSTAKLGYATKTVEVIVRKAVYIPPGVNGAVSARWHVDTNGSITIDGRDHTINGNLIMGSGTYGVYTDKTYVQGGSSKIGGTDVPRVDHVPANPADPSVIYENAPAGSLPTTPDEVMGGLDNGFFEGKLKLIAQSGWPNQYVTDPAALVFPLQGFTYVELPPGGVWDNAVLGDSSGVLVVHNSAGNAAIKNLKKGGSDACACFRGLVIADDIVHIHSTVTGAVVQLMALPSEGNVIGNGNGKVLYSREALEAAGAPAQKIWPIYSWREVK